MEHSFLNSSASAHQGPPLEFLWLELTNRCNLSCVHCYASSGPREPASYGLELPDWKRVLEEARELGCAAVQFIGGEPFLSPFLAPLLAYARQLGIEQLEIYTNATLLSRERLSICKQHDASIAFSFYAANNEAHDAVTTIKGSFERTIRGIKMAMSAGIPLRAGVIEIADQENNAYAGAALLASMGLTNIHVDRMRKLGRGKGTTSAPLQTELCGGCGHGRLAVDSTGQIFPCVFSHQRPIGHVNGGLAVALGSDKLAEFLDWDDLDLRCAPLNDPQPNCGPAAKCNPAGCNPASCTPVGPSCTPQVGPRCAPQGIDIEGREDYGRQFP